MKHQSVAIRYFLIFILLFLISPAISLAERENPYSQLMNISPQELFNKGMDYNGKGDINTAVKYYTVLTGIYTDELSRNDKLFCAKAYKELGNICYGHEEYSKAFTFYLKGLHISENEQFNDLTAQLYNNIGNIYNIFEEVDLGMEYYLKAIKTAQDYKKDKFYIPFLVNISTQYTYFDDIPNAEYYYHQLKEREKDSIDAQTKHFIYYIAAQIHEKKHEYVQAFDNYKKALDIAVANDLPGHICSTCNYLANLYSMTNQPDSALYYWNYNYSFTKEHNLQYLRRAVLQFLVDFYEKRGEEERAMHYKIEYWELADSIFGKQETARMKNAMFSYEIDKSYDEISKLAKNKEQNEKKIMIQKWIVWICCIGLIIVFSLLVLVYRQKKNLLQAYRGLFDRNKQITEYKEKYTLLKNELKLQQQQVTETVIKEDEEKNTSAVVTKNGLSDSRKEDIAKSIEYIINETKEYCKTDFSLDKLAELTHSNTSYVSQIINEMYNCNFRTLLSKYRLQEAENQLRNARIYNSHTIQSIAESVGYKSRWSFAQHFKEATGMTPSTYIRLLKEEKGMGKEFTEME